MCLSGFLITYNTFETFSLQRISNNTHQRQHRHFWCCYVIHLMKSDIILSFEYSWTNRNLVMGMGNKLGAGARKSTKKDSLLSVDNHYKSWLTSVYLVYYVLTL